MKERFMFYPHVDRKGKHMLHCGIGGWLRVQECIWWHQHHDERQQLQVSNMAKSIKQDIKFFYNAIFLCWYFYWTNDLYSSLQ